MYMVFWQIELNHVELQVSIFDSIHRWGYAKIIKTRYANLFLSVDFTCRNQLQQTVYVCPFQHVFLSSIYYLWVELRLIIMHCSLPSAGYCCQTFNFIKIQILYLFVQFCMQQLELVHNYSVKLSSKMSFIQEFS